MKLAILGAGISGAYLYRLLQETGHTVHVFDKDPRTSCGLTPCAWGTSRAFTDLVSAARLDPAEYILKHHSHVVIDNMTLGADLMTIDKPALVRDLLKGSHVDRSEPNLDDYERVIDATGVSRACLPPLQDDVIIECVQFRVEGDGDFETRIKLGRLGYSWCFPFSSSAGHVGCGSMLADPRVMLDSLGWMEGHEDKLVCGCTGKIRISSPHSSRPYFVSRGDREIWGVGEAIGCVSPLTGDGIVPGMKSVQILMENWESPAQYTAAILKEFKWMREERKVIDKIVRRERFTLKDAWVLKRNCKRMAIELGIKDAAVLIGNLGS